MKVSHYDFFAMWTRFNLVLPNVSEREGVRIGKIVEGLVKKVEEHISNFKETSEISEINRAAFHLPVKVSDETARILGLCQYYWELTDGAFDPGTWPVSKELKTNQVYPADLADRIKHSGWKNVRWEPAQQHVSFTSALTGIDTGGFGKGLALEKVISYLKNYGITSAFISFGDSSISVIGNHPFGPAWEIAVAHPVSKVSVSLHLTDASVSVSGLKILTDNGVVDFLPHVLNTVNGNLISENNLVLAISPSPLVSEILSTAFVSVDSSMRSRLIARIEDAQVFECNVSDKEFRQLK
jgi:FAD:protein FMN transferase